MLHVTTSGQGLPTNPYWNGTATANRSKVWSLGLRNPYRFGLKPARTPQSLPVRTEAGQRYSFPGRCRLVHLGRSERSVGSCEPRLALLRR
jgi:hypothetical protein